MRTATVADHGGNLNLRRKTYSFFQRRCAIFAFIACAEAPVLCRSSTAGELSPRLPCRPSDVCFLRQWTPGPSERTSTLSQVRRNLVHSFSSRAQANQNLHPFKPTSHVNRSTWRSFRQRTVFCSAFVVLCTEQPSQLSCICGRIAETTERNQALSMFQTSYDITPGRKIHIRPCRVFVPASPTIVSSRSSAAKEHSNGFPGIQTPKPRILRR